MGKVSLKADYERLAECPSVQNWLNGLSNSKATRTTALYSILRFSRHTGKDPEQLVGAKEAELVEPSPKLPFKTEDTLKGFAKNVKGGSVYAAYVKSFYAANHLRLDLKLVRPPPQREPAGLPDDEKLIALVNAAGTKQLKALILFLAESGARIGSVLKLQYRQVKADLESGALPCRVNFPAAITKGGRPYVGFIGQDGVEVLKDYLTWRSKDRQSKDIRGRAKTIKGRPLTDESYLFESRNGKPLSKTTTILRIQNAAYSSGLITSRTGLKLFHPHVFRQRAQTILEGSGVPLNWVDMLLGHIPRGASASAYSRPSEHQFKEAYKKAYDSLRIYKPSAHLKAAEKRFEEEKASWEARFKELRSLVEDMDRERKKELDGPRATSEPVKA